MNGTQASSSTQSNSNTGSSSNTVTLYTNTSPYNTYSPGVCQCGVCSAFTPIASCNQGDFQIGQTACCGGSCPPQPICSQINPSSCPSIGNTQALSINYVNGPSGPSLACTYNLNQFKTANDINTYASFATSDDPTLNTVILPYFCNTPVQTCPTDPVTGQQMTACSRYISTADDGQICQKWLAAYPQYQDSAFTAYCTANNTPDCGCLSRNSDPIFQTINRQATSPANCWYAKCSNSKDYLITSTIKNQTCPANTCDQIQQIYTQNNAVLPYQTTKNSLTCPITQPTGSNLWWIFLLIIGLVFLVLIISIILFSTGLVRFEPEPTERPPGVVRE